MIFSWWVHSWNLQISTFSWTFNLTDEWLIHTLDFNNWSRRFTKKHPLLFQKSMTPKPSRRTSWLCKDQCLDDFLTWRIRTLILHCFELHWNASWRKLKSVQLDSWLHRASLWLMRCDYWSTSLFQNLTSSGYWNLSVQTWSKSWIFRVNLLVKYRSNASWFENFEMESY